MSLKSRLKKKISKATDSVSDYAKRAGEKAKAGYRRYKDPILAGTAMALGAILAPVTGGASAVAGAALAASLYGAGRVAYKSNQANQEAERAEKDFNAQMAGLEGSSMADMIRRRRLRRGAGEGVAEFTSDSAGMPDAQEVAA